MKPWEREMLLFGSSSAETLLLGLAAAVYILHDFIYRVYTRISAQDSMLSIFCRGIESQGLKHECGKRRLSRDLMVSKDMLSLKSREGRFSFFFWSTS